MTREEALEAISTLPPGTKLFIRTGQFMDDAYPAVLRTFNENTGIGAYFDIDREKTAGRKTTAVLWKSFLWKTNEAISSDRKHEKSQG
jgi:hypothetical protein